MFDEKRYEFEINGVKASFSTGKLARKSQAAVLAQMGDTVILATVNVGKALPDADFFPLTVEYIEMMYAAGKISGSRFVKRDRFPSDDAVLKGRVVDRSIRPVFPTDYRNEVSVIVKVLSFDSENEPLILAVNAVSIALQMSDAPFIKPISGVRVGMKDGNLIPYNSHADRDEIEESSMNLFLSGDGGTLTNIDSNFNECSEEKVLEAMSYGLDLMKPWLDAQEKFLALVGDKEKASYDSFAIPTELIEKVKAEFSDKIAATLESKTRNKDREALIEEMVVSLGSAYSKRQVAESYEEVAKKLLRKAILQEGRRVDGRQMDEIRPLGFEVGLLPRVHGSALFTRGITQILTIVTLGSSRSQQMVDDMTGEDMRRYLHYYVEAPYSFGEAGKVRYIPGRREVGHGALAEKALYPVLPSMEEFPYTIMLMSEIMSEGGSSSQGSATASSMALMDAGVPIKRPVAGIAVGVVMDESTPDDFKVMTDIIDIEDFYGMMDFKVAGSMEGVTSIQMDTKSAGLPLKVFEVALKQAKDARIKILNEMVQTIGQSRSQVSAYAPKVEVLKMSPTRIGELIGPGGKNIKAITEESGAEINIEQDGTLQIFAANQEALDKAKELVNAYVFEPKIGETYDGVVEGITDFGAFVEIARGVSGLVHISEIADGYVKNVEEHLKMGEKVKVKVLDVDPNGKIKLSIKALNPGSGEGGSSDGERKLDRRDDFRSDRGRRDDRGRGRRRDF